MADTGLPVGQRVERLLAAGAIPADAPPRDVMLAAAAWLDQVREAHHADAHFLNASPDTCTGGLCADYRKYRDALAHAAGVKTCWFCGRAAGHTWHRDQSIHHHAFLSSPAD
jgi:hypothetical protein